MTPTVGRIVHFHEPFELPMKGESYPARGPIVAGPPLAAMILRCGPEGEKMVLEVHPPKGPTYKVIDAQFSSEPKARHWSWPPYIRQGPPMRP